MKFIYYFVFLAVFSVFMFSCENTGVLTPAQIDAPDVATLENSVAIIDLQTRSISENDYVRQVVIAQLSNQKMAASLNIETVLYTDDGNHNDQVANDGVYTSSISFSYDKNVRYNENTPVQSYLNGMVIVDESFNKQDQLEEYVTHQETINRVDQKTGPFISCSCGVNFYVEDCHGCIAEELYGGCWCVEFGGCGCDAGWSWGG